MRILVTGSSGFVGKALVERLRSAGHVATGLSRRPDHDALLGDLLRSETLTSAIATFEPELIYHLAAQTALKGEPAEGYRVNTDGTANLIRAVAESSSVKRVIWMSSQLVSRPGRTPVSDTDYDPADAYGASKADAERMIRAQSGGGKEWVIVRSTTIWGPGMSEHYAGVIRLIRRGLYFNVGRRPLRKSYSYIENLTGQLLSVGTASAGQVHGQTFYLADSDPIDLRAWADGFAAEFGRRLHTMPVPLAKGLGLAGDLAARLGLPAPVRSSRIANMLTEYVYDTGPIDAVHGRTAIDWREGVRRTADWIKADT